MALLVPDDSLLPFALAKKYFNERNKSFFIWDKYSHLAICLCLMEPHLELKVLFEQNIKSFFPLMLVVPAWRLST